MKKKMSARIAAVTLSIMMAFTMMPQTMVYAAENENSNVMDYAGSGDMEGTIEQLCKIAEELEIFTEEEQLMKFKQALTHLSSLPSIASGAITVLQVLGIIEDPTEAKLLEILDRLQAVQDKLSDMDSKLNRLIEDMNKLKYECEKQWRVTAADENLKSWRATFKGLDELKKGLDTYQRGVSSRGKKWLENAEKEGVRALYAKDKGGKLVKVYTKGNYSEGIPGKSQSQETVVKEECIGLPKISMPKAIPVRADENWIEIAKERMKEAFIIAANKEGQANAPAGTYLEWKEKKQEEWNNLSDRDKEKMAERYAADLVDSVQYKIGCDVMSEEVSPGNDMPTALGSWLDNLADNRCGLGALIQSIYNSRGFEGEAKKDIENACNYVIFNAGYYGFAVLNCIDQDSNKKSDKLRDLQKTWLKTMEKLIGMKKAAITGHDNYCYVTGTLVEYKQLEATSEAYFKYAGSTSYEYEPPKYMSVAEGCKATPWKLRDINGEVSNLAFVELSKSGILFAQYLMQKEKGSKDKFAGYLNRNGVGIPADFGGKITTKYCGAKAFSLGDGLECTSRSFVGGSYSDGDTAHINTDKKKKDSNFVFHDKIDHDYIDTNSGSMQAEQTLAHRAGLKWGKWFAAHDELDSFTNKEMSIAGEVEKSYYTYFPSRMHYETTVSYIQEVHALYTRELPEEVMVGPLENLRKDIEKNSGNDTEKKPAYSKAKWTKLDVDHLDLYEKDEGIDKGIEGLIDHAIAEAKENGLTVSLSREERSELTKKIRKKVFDMQSVLKKNSCVRNLDVFGIDGNDDLELELASRALQGTYIDQDGNSLIPPENINTMAEYEPAAILHFEKKKGKIKPVIEAAFDVTPLIVVWDSNLKEFQATPVYNEVMEEMGLAMNVVLPASFIKAGTAEITHYDGDTLEVRDEAEDKVKGSGDDKYVTMIATSCSPFEVKEPDNGKGNGGNGAATGDESSILLMILIMITSMSILATLIIRRFRVQG